MGDDVTVDGDVTLRDHRETPVALRGVEDVYVGTDAVSGRLTLHSPEYVFTDLPVDGDRPVTDDAVATEIAGEEDGYVEDVAGDVLVADVEDVFLARDAADSVAVVGSEQVFRDAAAQPPLTPDAYDVSLTGWTHTREATAPTNGVAVRGAKNELRVTEATGDLTVYVVGWDNEVHVEGRGFEASVYFVGRDNTVSVGPYGSATIAAESGYDNAVDQAPYPHDALIETTESEARRAFGRHRLTYQEPAPGKDWCPNCGESADAVIARRHMDALFLFWYPVRTYDEGHAYECEHCSPNARPDVALSESERTDVLQ